MSKPVTKTGAVGAFALGGRACSDAMFHVLNRAFEEPQAREERAAQPLAGGIMQHGYQCGMVWGAALAAGAQAFRMLGPGAEAEGSAIRGARAAAQLFYELHGTINCSDITHMNKEKTALDIFVHFFLKGGAIGCFRMIGGYAPPAFDAVASALAEPKAAPPCGPVSCAACVARRRGASEEHAITVSGLAGGIGLSGGACGALGAAIWLEGVKILEEGGKLGLKDPRALALIDRFMKASNYELECAEIVGRKFDRVTDHAAWIRSGGCSALIDALADAEEPAADEANARAAE